MIDDLGCSRLHQCLSSVMILITWERCYIVDTGFAIGESMKTSFERVTCIRVWFLLKISDVCSIWWFICDLILRIIFQWFVLLNVIWLYSIFPSISLMPAQFPRSMNDSSWLAYNVLLDMCILIILNNLPKHLPQLHLFILYNISDIFQVMPDFSSQITTWS